MTRTLYRFEPEEEDSVYEIQTTPLYGVAVFEPIEELWLPVRVRRTKGRGVNLVSTVSSSLPSARRWARWCRWISGIENFRLHRVAYYDDTEIT